MSHLLQAKPAFPPGILSSKWQWPLRALWTSSTDWYVMTEQYLLLWNNADSTVGPVVTWGTCQSHGLIRNWHHNYSHNNQHLKKQWGRKIPSRHRQLEGSHEEVNEVCNTSSPAGCLEGKNLAVTVTDVSGKVARQQQQQKQLEQLQQQQQQKECWQKQWPQHQQQHDNSSKANSKNNNRESWSW